MSERYHIGVLTTMNQSTRQYTTKHQIFSESSSFVVVATSFHDFSSKIKQDRERRVNLSVMMMNTYLPMS